jgi:rubrerythrin
VAVVEARFNADEILAIAEQIEQNGAAFYDEAAARATQPELQRLLSELAQWEGEHRHVFASMRGELTEREREPITYDPDGQLVDYLKVIADQQVFSRGRTPLSLLGDPPDEGRIIRAAIALEHESIAFYAAMTPVLPPRLGRPRLAAIIQEEYSHIVRLSGKAGR